MRPGRWRWRWQQRGRWRRRTAFTLVELLIAATMMAILMAGLSAHLRGGMMVWRRATHTSEALQRRRVGLEQLERDLANAMRYYDQPGGYGEAVGQAPPPRFEASLAGWYTVLGGTDTRLPMVQYVRYECGDRDGAQGLWRVTQTVGQARLQQDGTAELLIPGCAAMALRYASEAPPEQAGVLSWSSVWNDPEASLPRLIELTLHLADGAQITRLVTIPIGVVPRVKAT